MQHFKRSIKKDIKAFSKLKDYNQWDYWYLETKAHACKQDLSEVINPVYIHTSPPDKLPFDEKTVFMYAVLVEFLLTGKGKSLVRHYELYWDTQKIHRVLLTHAVTSTKTSVGSDQLLTYIITTILVDGSRRDSNEAFILQWPDQIRKYDLLVKFSDQTYNTHYHEILGNFRQKIG